MTHPEIDRLRRELLRAYRRPRAWWRFLSGSWAVTRATAREHPALRRAWQRRALGHALMLPALARALGCKPTAVAPWLTYAIQQADLYVHLGLNRPAESLAVRNAFPLAIEATTLRAYAAAALSSETSRPRLALGLGLASDLLDGVLARRHGEATALGALLDGEYDASLCLATAHLARRRGVLPRGVEAVLWLRFAVPLLAGVLAYGAAPGPIAVRSRRPGRLAGAVQAAIVWTALSGHLRREARWPAATLAVTGALSWAGHAAAYHAGYRGDEQVSTFARLRYNAG